MQDKKSYITSLNSPLTYGLSGLPETWPKQLTSLLLLFLLLLFTHSINGRHTT